MTEENHLPAGPTEMEIPDEQDRDEAPADDSRLEESGFAEKKKIGVGFWIAAFWLVLITFLAVFAPVLPFKEPNENFIVFEQKENPITGKMQDRPIQPPYSPSGDHWLGTDQDARDLLSRSIH